MNISNSEILKILSNRKKDNISFESIKTELENVAKSFPYNSVEDNVLTAFENLSNSSKQAEEQRQTINKEDSCTSH